MTAKKKGFSLTDLSAVAPSNEGIEFEYEFNGTPTGVWFKVIGSHAQAVQDESNRLVNERRTKQAAREQAAASSMKGALVVDKIEDDIEFGRRLAAVRLIGWRKPGETAGLTEEQAKRFEGITDDFTPAAALALVMSNADISAKILEASNDLGRFMKALSQGS